MPLLTDAGPAAREWTMLAIGVYGLPAALALFVVAIGIPFAVVSALSLLPCGWAAGFAGPYLHLTADPSPPGSWTLTQFETEADERKLFHSKAYQDKKVMEFLVKWIEERVKQTNNIDTHNNKHIK